MKIPRYIQSEPQRHVADLMSLSPADRGLYAVLLWLFYGAGGVLPDDVSVLAQRCGVTDLEMNEFLRTNGAHFLRKNGEISHKIVRSDTVRARRLSQVRARAGLIGSELRWQSYSKAIAKPGVNVNVNVKGKEDSNSNTNKATIQVRSLRFVTALNLVVPTKTESDKAAFRNLASWVSQGISAGQFSEEMYRYVLDAATEARNGRRPIALFFAILKRDYGYKETG